MSTSSHESVWPWLAGHATTIDGAEGSGADGRGLQPARAVRRALASAGMKARQVDVVFACYSTTAFAAPRERAAAAITLALGPASSSVRVDLCAAGGTGSAIDGSCERASNAVDDGSISAAVAVAIGIDGRNDAYVFSRPEG